MASGQLEIRILGTKTERFLEDRVVLSEAGPLTFKRIEVMFEDRSTAIVEYCVMSEGQPASNHTLEHQS